MGTGATGLKIILLPPTALLDKPCKISNTLDLLLVGPLSVSIYSAHLADQDGDEKAYEDYEDGDDEAYEDSEDEAYEDGEDDLASDAAGVQKEARSSDAAHSRGRTATLVWSGLAGWGETFWGFEIAHRKKKKERKKRMNLQLKRASRQFGKIPFYRAKISSQGQVRRRCLQRSPPCHHSLCSPFK